MVVSSGIRWDYDAAGVHFSWAICAEMRRGAARKHGPLTRENQYTLLYDDSSIKGWTIESVGSAEIENMHFFGVPVPFILAALATRGVAETLNSFSATCHDYNLQGATLIATCGKLDQTYARTSIDLDTCLRNHNGVLECAQK